MWKTFAGWVLAFFGMARDLEEERAGGKPNETPRTRRHAAAWAVAVEVEFVK